jgi:hypothetical protein
MYSGHTIELMLGGRPPTRLSWLASELLTSFNFRGVVVHFDLPFVELRRWILDFLFIDINLVTYYSQRCQSLMIFRVANRISRAQQGLTLPVPQSSANKRPFAKLFSFSDIQFTGIIW